MSWYVSFFIAIQDKNGKITPLGPYDNEGKLKCVHETSRSFTTDLHESFYPIEDDMVTDELKKEAVESVKKAYPSLEVSEIDGGQDVYFFNVAIF